MGGGGPSPKPLNVVSPSAADRLADEKAFLRSQLYLDMDENWRWLRQNFSTGALTVEQYYWYNRYFNNLQQAAVDMTDGIIDKRIRDIEDGKAPNM